MNLFHRRAVRGTMRQPVRRRRAVTAAAAAGLAMVAASTLVSPGAEAVAFGPYDIDGTVPGSDSAQMLTDESGNTKELGPKNASSTKIGVIHTAAPPMLDYTNPNAQVDLKTAWLNLKRVSNHDWVYFAWERDSNTGSGFIAFEFMKNGLPSGCGFATPTTPATSTDAQLIAGCNPWRSATEQPGDRKVGRSAGDFLLLWDQSGSSAVFYKRVWTQANLNAPLVLGAPVLLDASTQAKGVYSADGTKGEASVDLTAANLTNGTSCTTFANVIPSTVTGNSDTADYKDTILKKIDPLSSCQGTLGTTPKQADGTTDIPDGGLSIGTGSVEVKDLATVGVSGGNASPTGTVSFWLCKVDAPAVCGANQGTSLGSVPLTGGSYPATATSPSAWVTAAGRYCWRSSWSGDANNSIAGVSDNAANECFTVNPVTATLSTTASGGGVLGSTVADSATLGGTATQPMDPVVQTSAPPVAPASGAPAPAGGSIVFKLYGPSATGCGSLVYTSPAVAVSGNGSYSTPAPQYAPLAIGRYSWKAEYTGSSPNTLGTTHNDTCNQAAEDRTITDVESSMTTAQSWIPNDSATVSAPAGGALAGTVSFALYANATCSGSPITGYTASRSVSGASPQTVGTAFTAPITTTGTTAYSWKVTWDSTNPAQRDITDSCRETSSVTVTNGGTATSTTP